MNHPRGGAPGTRVALGPTGDAVGKSAHHIDRDQQAKIASRSKLILPRTAGLKDRWAVRHPDLAMPAVLELRPFSTAVTRSFTCSSSDAIASSIARRGSQPLGRHHVIHAIIEILDPELRLLERKIAVLRIFGDFAVANAARCRFSRVRSAGSA